MRSLLSLGQEVVPLCWYTIRWAVRLCMNETMKKRLVYSKLFRSLTREEAKELFDSDIGQIRSYKKGEIVISPVEPFGYLGVILRGELDVLRVFETGVQCQVHLLKANNVIGIDTISNGRDVNLFFHVAKTDVEVYLLPVESVLKSGEISEGIRQKMVESVLEILVHENFRQHQKIDVLSVSNLRDRIYRYLSYQQFKRKTKVFEIPYNREQMADYLCVNRSSLSRELSNMEKEGLIRYCKNRFELLE